MYIWSIAGATVVITPPELRSTACQSLTTACVSPARGADWLIVSPPWHSLDDGSFFSNRGIAVSCHDARPESVHWVEWVDSKVWTPAWFRHDQVVSIHLIRLNYHLVDTRKDNVARYFHIA